MVFGELYRNGAEWKFRAVGQGMPLGCPNRPRLRRQRLKQHRAFDAPADTFSAGVPNFSKETWFRWLFAPSDSRSSSRWCR